MNPKTLATLEFDKILARLAGLCQTTAPLTLSLSKGERRPAICHSERSEESGDGWLRCFVWDTPPQTPRFARGDTLREDEHCC
jgi:hypothetical protein